VSQPRDRRALYTEVLSGLRDLSADLPAGRFDQLVDDLVASGRLTHDEGAALRFWQRETLRNQADHLVTTASATLSALDDAREATRESVASADTVWQASPHAPRHAIDTAPEVEAPAAQEPAPPATDRPEPVPTERGRHRAADPVPLPAHLDLTLAHEPREPVPAALLPEPIAPAAPQQAATPPAPAPADHEPASPSARRRRLLVAGLTVINESGTNGDDPDASDSDDDPYDHRPAVG
jgi:hypothetical protein